MGYALYMEKQDLQERRGESDQLPEEAPEEAVEEDAGGDTREEAKDSPGGADDSHPEQATGNP